MPKQTYWVAEKAQRSFPQVPGFCPDGIFIFAMYFNTDMILKRKSSTITSQCMQWWLIRSVRYKLSTPKYTTKKHHLRKNLEPAQLNLSAFLLPRGFAVNYRTRQNAIGWFYKKNVLKKVTLSYIFWLLQMTITARTNYNCLVDDCALLDKETTLQRNCCSKMTIWEPKHDHVISKNVIYTKKHLLDSLNDGKTILFKF